MIENHEITACENVCRDFSWLWQLPVLLAEIAPLLALVWAIRVYFVKRKDDREAEDKRVRRDIFLEFLTENANLAMALKSSNDEYRAAFTRFCYAADKLFLVETNEKVGGNVKKFRFLAEKLRANNDPDKEEKFLELQSEWHDLHKKTLDEMKAVLSGN